MASASFEMLFCFSRSAVRPEMRVSAAFASSPPDSAEPDSFVFSSRSDASDACSAASSSSADLPLPFSSAKRFVDLG